MRLIAFSDLHLTAEFNEAQANWIKEGIQAADQILIDGDFWDGYLLEYEDFIQSAWQVLFPLFKSKKTIYLRGNHDGLPAEAAFDAFAEEWGESYELSLKNTTFFFIHGHQ